MIQLNYDYRITEVFAETGEVFSLTKSCIHPHDRLIIPYTIRNTNVTQLQQTCFNIKFERNDDFSTKITGGFSRKSLF